jgi:hypothetical protein
VTKIKKRFFRRVPNDGDGKETANGDGNCGHNKLHLERDQHNFCLSVDYRGQHKKGVAMGTVNKSLDGSMYPG